MIVVDDKIKQVAYLERKKRFGMIYELEIDILPFPYTRGKCGVIYGMTSHNAYRKLQTLCKDCGLGIPITSSACCQFHLSTLPGPRFVVL